MSMRVGLMLGGLWLGACGGSARELGNGDPLTEAQGTGGGAASPSTGRAGANSQAGSGAATASAGASSYAGTGATTAGAGAPALPLAMRACADPQPHPSGGGYRVCADGSLRRPAAGRCDSSLPRAAPDTPLAFDECALDTDCAASPHGFCAYGKCQYGCVTDDECESGQACYCGPVVGACIQASCRSNADCPEDFPCTGFQAPGFAAPDALACQSPSDECVTDAQCNSLNPRVSCKVQVDHRVCYRDTVG